MSSYPKRSLPNPGRAGLRWLGGGGRTTAVQSPLSLSLASAASLAAPRFSPLTPRTWLSPTWTTEDERFSPTCIPTRLIPVDPHHCPSPAC